MKPRWRNTLALAWAAMTAATTAAAAPTTPASPSTPTATAVAAAPWWTGLGDPVLDVLMQTAVPATPQAQQRVVQLYLALRVGALRLQLLSGLANATRNEQALWMSAPIDEQRDAALAAAGQRLAAIESAGAGLGTAATEQFAALAADTGLAETQLHDLLAPALSQPGLPNVVSRLPAEAATARVPEPLAALADEARRVSEGEQWVESRRVEWQARQQRQQLGGNDALGTLQAYQQYVIDTDQLALASGRLALNWALWLQRSSAPSTAR